MKLIKSLILVISILVCGLSFTGCGSELPAKECQTGTENTSEATESLESIEKKEFIDSIYKLTAIFAAVTDSISEHNSKIATLESKFNDTKNHITLLSVISLVSSVIALVIAGISIYLVKILKNRSARHRSEIECLNSWICNIQNQICNSQSSPPQSQNSSNASNGTNAITKRLESIEHNVFLLQKQLATLNAPAQLAPAKPVTEQIGYFGVPSQMSQTEAYFRKIIESASDPDVRFSATVRGNHVEFQLKEGTMSSLRSSDTMKLAVETTGYLLSDATSMKTLKPGEAELRESRWVITKKAQILLLK